VAALLKSASRDLEREGFLADALDGLRRGGLDPLFGQRGVVVAQFEPHTYDDGLRAGVQARLRSAPITPYQRVGLDDFARGFRAGYFSSRGSHVGNTLGGRAAS